jgi:cyclophilin family peptidyl-prolyl cis-trans isomerase
MRYWILHTLMMVLFVACGSPSGNRKESTSGTKDTFAGSYQSNAKAIVSIETFDHYTRRMKTGYGFYVAENLIVTHLDLIKGCYKAKVAAMDMDDYTEVKGFVAYDISQNLVLLQTYQEYPHFLKESAEAEAGDSIYSLYRKDKKLFVRRTELKPRANIDSLECWPVSGSMLPGKPVFLNNHCWFGLIQSRELDGQKQTIILDQSDIKQLMKKAESKARSLYDLRTKTNKVYPSHETIKGFHIKTDLGDITIRLFDETPKYRDNFIRLVSDQFYDSLLVHRVIHKFLIQSGAADTKDAGKDDVVGWKGPGYTLPMNVQPHLFHWRGAIAASKLPADRNPKNRSDGSQFYIVAGRSFSDSELDDLEKERGKTFTQEQRRVYTTQGGAPHLDGDYTVFGEVVSGMSVVDKIAAVKTYAVDRPLNDIRVRTIEIIKK